MAQSGFVAPFHSPTPHRLAKSFQDVWALIGHDQAKALRADLVVTAVQLGSAPPRINKYPRSRCRVAQRRLGFDPELVRLVSDVAASMPTAAPPRDGGGDRPFVRTAGSSAHVAAAMICPLDGLDSNALDEPVAHPALAHGQGSGFREHFERQWLVPKWIREHQGARGSSVRVLRLDRLESHGRSIDCANAPHCTACSYEVSDREAIPRSVFDIPVGEAKQEDWRRDFATVPIAGLGQGVVSLGSPRGFSFESSLDLDLTYDIVLDPNDRPLHPLAPKSLANLRSRESTEVVLEVTVREANDERACRDHRPLRSLGGVVPDSLGSPNIGSGIPTFGGHALSEEGSQAAPSDGPVHHRDAPLPRSCASRGTRIESRENTARGKRLHEVDAASQGRRIHRSIREGEWAGSALPPPLPLPREAVWVAGPAVPSSVVVS